MEKKETKKKSIKIAARGGPGRAAGGTIMRGGGEERPKTRRRGCSGTRADSALIRRGHVVGAGHATEGSTSRQRRWKGRRAPADGVVTGCGK